MADTLDRFQEAHFWIHMLEQHYHQADYFRWYLAAFLKALKETPHIARIELQSEAGFKRWYAAEASNYYTDELTQALAKKRDIVVHSRMLVPRSTVQVGVTEGRGLKIGLTFPVHPMQDSNSAMDSYLRHVATSTDFLGILVDDEDSIPCVYRQWYLDDLNRDILDLCANAWLRLGTLLKKVLEWLGESDVPALSLACRHAPQQVYFKLYDRTTLRQRLDALRATSP